MLYTIAEFTQWSSLNCLRVNNQSNAMAPAAGYYELRKGGLQSLFCSHIREVIHSKNRMTFIEFFDERVNFCTELHHFIDMKHLTSLIAASMVCSLPFVQPVTAQEVLQSEAVVSDRVGDKVFLSLDLLSLRGDLDSLFSRLNQFSSSNQSASTWGDVLAEGNNPERDVDFSGYDALGVANLFASGTLNADSLLLSRDAEIEGNLWVKGISFLDSTWINSYLLYSGVGAILESANESMEFVVTDSTQWPNSPFSTGLTQSRIDLGVDELRIEHFPSVTTSHGLSMAEGGFDLYDSETSIGGWDTVARGVRSHTEDSFAQLYSTASAFDEVDVSWVNSLNAVTVSESGIDVTTEEGSIGVHSEDELRMTAQDSIVVGTYGGIKFESSLDFLASSGLGNVELDAHAHGRFDAGLNLEATAGNLGLFYAEDSLVLESGNSMDLWSMGPMLQWTPSTYEVWALDNSTISITERWVDETFGETIDLMSDVITLISDEIHLDADYISISGASSFSDESYHTKLRVRNGVNHPYSGHIRMLGNRLQYHDGSGYQTLTNDRTKVGVTAHKESVQSIPSGGGQESMDWVEDVDTHNAFNPSTGEFAAPRAGWYQVSFSFASEVMTIQPGAEVQMIILDLLGDVQELRKIVSYPAGGTGRISGSMSESIELSNTESLRFQLVYLDAAGNTTSMPLEVTNDSSSEQFGLTRISIAEM